MKSRIGSTFIKSLLFFLIFTVICGGIYTFFITGVSQLAFKDKANGSMIEVDGKVYGSELMGQQFSGKNHLWGRIMNLDTETFTNKEGKAVAYGWASNKTPAGDELEGMIAERVKMIQAAHPEKAGEKIPVDLVTCSGSGNDPHISVDAAYYQAERIAKNTGRTEKEVKEIIDEYTDGRFLGVFGEPRVNVLKVNLALDGILKSQR